MIIDSSAIVAIVFAETEGLAYAKAVLDGATRQMSAANWLEAAMVIDSRGKPVAIQKFNRLIDELDIEIVPVTVEIARLARQANSDFGRGNHPARLNYGDCFAYALAKATGEPLLFKGNDFSQTDIRPALPA